MTVNRRSFIQQSAGLACLGSASCAPSTQSAPLGPGRETLVEPGPMLPPVPAVFLTTRGFDGEPDEISVVWAFVVNGVPPQIGIAVGDEHIVGARVAEFNEFVLNIPTAEIVDKFDVVDMNSSKVGDKFTLSGLTRGEATSVNAPTVEEAPIHLECRVFNSVRVPPMRTVFFAEVVATTALVGACDENGRLIVPAVPFFGMTAGSGEFYTMGESIGHIGKSVGRDDIKY
jgi:flavin reductase (DIM6/NTAB) family NADH-FMN oxidoreductase RutF